MLAAGRTAQTKSSITRRDRILPHPGHFTDLRRRACAPFLGSTGRAGHSGVHACTHAPRDARRLAGMGALSRAGVRGWRRGGRRGRTRAPIGARRPTITRPRPWSPGSLGAGGAPPDGVSGGCQPKSGAPGVRQAGPQETPGARVLHACMHAPAGAGGLARGGAGPQGGSEGRGGGGRPRCVRVRRRGRVLTRTGACALPSRRASLPVSAPPTRRARARLASGRGTDHYGAGTQGWSWQDDPCLRAGGRT